MKYEDHLSPIKKKNTQYSNTGIKKAKPNTSTAQLKSKDSLQLFTEKQYFTHQIPASRNSAPSVSNWLKSNKTFKRRGM